MIAAALLLLNPLLPLTHVPLLKVRELYERLLDRTQHVKVWASYAAFEASKDVPDGTGSVGVGGGLTAARAIYRRAYEALKV